MADCSNGRVMTRTGSHHTVPKGATCDDHPHIHAVARIQGETDSFGCEYIDMCQPCLTEYEHWRKDNPRQRSYEYD